jgi:type IV secretion system protein TrbG
MLSLRIVITVTLSSAWMLSAQSQPPAPPPAGVKRVPPAAQGQIPPKIEDPGSLPGPTSGITPKDLRPKADVPLSSTALEAVRVSERWQGEKNAPSPGPDGRVMYSFGAGLPTVVCAPLRVCMIELQAGEKIVGEPHIGDSVRWNISPAMYGTGEQATAVIILKPQTPGLDTNLLITTDRRAYYLRLISKPDDYVARVAFAYPDDDSSRKWQQQLAEQQTLAKQEKHAAEVPPAVLSVEKVNFDYTIRGGDEHIRPVRVFDDGAKTYIQMPAEIQHREAPVLLVLGKDGKGEMTNYRVKDQTYIVDRLFDHANLVLGSGKKAQKVEISHGHK